MCWAIALVDAVVRDDAAEKAVPFATRYICTTVEFEATPSCRKYTLIVVKFATVTMKAASYTGEADESAVLVTELK